MFISIEIDYSALSQGDSRLYVTSDRHSYVVQNQNKSIAVMLRKRYAYPVTYCEQVSPHQVVLGYGDPQKRSGREFLVLSITADGTITLERDAYTTLPIFYARVRDVLYIHNDYSELVGLLPAVTLSRSALLEHISPVSHRMGTTLIEEVRLLEEREMLYADVRQLRVRYPQVPVCRKSKDQPSTNPREFPRVFEARLQHFIQTRLAEQVFAFQVSGELDSSTLPLFCSRIFKQEFLLSTVVSPDAVAAARREKAEALAAFTGYPLFQKHVDAAAEFPLADMLLGGRYRPIYSAEQLTYELSFGAYARDMRERGVSVLCTGLGGDDIFENIVDPQTRYMYATQEQTRRRECELAPYLTPLYRKHYVASTPSKPHRGAPVLPSGVSSVSAYMGYFVEQDIWPVSPFHDPELYEFCQGLPAYLRANKNILRMYHQARGFIPLIYNGLKSDPLGEFLTTTFCSDLFRNAVSVFAANAVSVKLGYVDPDKLRETLETARTNNGHSPWLQNIFYWLGLEIGLQSTPNLKV